MSKVKLLFLAIDGLDYDLVYRYDCKFLQWLTKGNQHGVLISDDPTGADPRGDAMTGPAWTTIYTGLPAHVHGLDCRMWFQGRSAGFELNVPTIWTILQRDYSMGLMALPVFAPSHRPMPEVWPDFNGWAINGFPCAGKVTQLQTKGLYGHEIPDDFRLEEFTASMADPPDYATLVESRERQAMEKLDLALKLNREDIMAVGVQMLDWACHREIDRADAYAFIDKWANKAWVEFSPENFVICSDHGFEALRTVHRETGFYIVSIPGGEVPRRIYDIAPLTLFAMERR